MNRMNSLMTKKVAIVTNNLNCERHIQYFSTLEKYFILNGWVINEDFNVDKVIICGCGFHNMMLDKVQNLLTELRDIDFPEEDIVLMGCIQKTHENEWKSNFKGQIVSFHDEEGLDKIINASIPFKETELTNVFVAHKDCRITDENKVFHIKIANGCLRGCTFCVINKAKGYIQSVPADTIREQFKKAVEHGYQKVFLMGEDTFAYGYDTGDSIIELIESLLEIKPDTEFHFGNLHNRWLVQYADDIISLCKRGHIKKLHIGLQHINDAILEKMGRDTKFNEIYDAVCRLKQECPEVYLGVDLLIGFPGETEEMFIELMEFFKNDTCFDNVQHNGYSDVDGAASTMFENKNSAAVISSRWMRMTKALQEKTAFNRTDDTSNFDATYKATREMDYSFSKDSFIDLKELQKKK